jgi:2-C-methyl-D-erythritol 4-phosphate cytidylyltransferase
LNGIKATEAEYVLIHDGARCLVSTDLIERMAAKVVETSCIAAVPSKDTIKIVKEGVVCDTPNRENLYIVQTPQAFNRTDLLNAYLKLDELSDEKRRTLTDDSMIMENAGKPVQIVAGEYSNIKVTTPEDLDFVKNIKKY